MLNFFKKAAVKPVDSLLEQLTENIGINAYKCPVMLLSGKTTMIHFLLPDKTRLQERRDITDTMFCFQFVSIPDLLVRMQAAKFIPHTDMNRYPSIRDRLK